MRTSLFSVKIEPMSSAGRIAKKLMIPFIAIVLFLIFFLDDILILGAVFHGGKAGGIVSAYILVILAYIVIFLAFPALLGAIFSGYMFIRSIQENEDTTAKAFAVIAGFQLLLVVFFSVLSGYLISVLGR